MEKKESFLETVKTVCLAIFIAMIIRAFLFEPFKIPSGSMYPNLYVGDFLFVSKYSYGYSKHSFPFSLPAFEGRVWQDMPQRGDVAVFKYPKDNRTDFIKRIIGLPGDKIKMEKGRLFINGKMLPRIEMENFITRNDMGKTERYFQYEEILPNGIKHSILEISDEENVDNIAEVTVPENSFFVMGDNRDRSDDSRFNVGFVPVENLVGKARVLFFSYDTDQGAWYKPWTWGKKIRWRRLFSKIS